MKYCYRTNLVFGIICLVLEFFVIVSLAGNARKFFNKNIAEAVVQTIGLSLFAVMGVMLIISARKIKNKIRHDELASKISEI
jgi:hypothetical protein